MFDWILAGSTGQVKSIRTVSLTCDNHIYKRCCHQHYIVPQSNHGLSTYKRNVDYVSEMITNTVEHQFVVNPEN